MPLTPVRLAGLTVALSLAVLAGGCGDDDTPSASTPAGTTPKAASRPPVPADFERCKDISNFAAVQAPKGGCTAAKKLLTGHKKEWAEVGKTEQTVDDYRCVALSQVAAAKVIGCSKGGEEAVRFTAIFEPGTLAKP